VSPAQKDGIPNDLARLLGGIGARVTASRPIDHGTQHTASQGAETATINVYHTGKVAIGGKASTLKRSLEEWRLARTGGGAPSRDVASTGTGSGAGGLDPTPRVGTDEAGKGDYFGPLVVAGARVLGKEAAQKLLGIGVRDSKTLSGYGARRLASQVIEALGPENTRVVVLPPREYEARRAGAGNVNRLLGEINAQMIGELEDEVELFVVDEFARAARSYIEPHVPDGIRLEVRPRAESDAAVASASILARARYLEEMDRLSERVGFELPRGATHVVGAARRVYEERGMEGLAEAAKVHFATTERVVGVVRAKAGRAQG
jgi:ribonuclease HIII